MAKLQFISSDGIQALNLFTDSKVISVGLWICIRVVIDVQGIVAGEVVHVCRDVRIVLVLHVTDNVIGRLICWTVWELVGILRNN